MPFRVKDILIDVLLPQPCAFHTTILCHHFCTHIPSFCHVGCTFQITCHFHHSVIPCGLHCTHLWSGCQFQTFPCPGGSIVCPGGSIACPGGSACGGSILDPGLLDPAVIKERMKAEMAAAQAMEETMAEAMRPQTLEQVDLLEGKLKEALEDLSKRRDELRKKK